MAAKTHSAPTCANDHSAEEMIDRGGVLHGQSRRFECPTCKRLVLVSNVPCEDDNKVRLLRAARE